MLAAALGAAVAVGANPLGMFLAIVIAVIGLLLFFGLLVMKIAVSVTTVIVFVGMPLAIVPVPRAAVDPRAGGPRVRGLPGGPGVVGAVLRGRGGASASTAWPSAAAAARSTRSSSRWWRSCCCT